MNLRYEFSIFQSQIQNTTSQWAGVLVVTNSEMATSPTNPSFSTQEGIPTVNGEIKHVLHQNS